VLHLCSEEGMNYVFLVKNRKNDCPGVVAALVTRGFLRGKIICISPDSDVNDPSVIEQWHRQVLNYLQEVYWYWLFRPEDDENTVLVDDYP
jgi:hypothetical protein